MKRTANKLFLSGFITLLMLWAGVLFAAQDPASKKVKKVDQNATLKEIKGDVLVYRGVKYLPAKDEMRVKDGDRLMVMNKSQVTIEYDDGCDEVIDSFRIFPVDMPACHILWLDRLKSFPGNVLALGGLHLIEKNTRGKRKKRKVPVSP